MEAFSLLKYWKTSGGPRHSSLSTAPESTTIVTAVRDHDSDAPDDDGPFFDLEFAVPAEEGDDHDDDDGSNDEEEYDDDVTEEGDVDDKKEEAATEIISNELEEEDEEVEEGESEPNLTYSPSDDLFFKGRIVRIDGSEEIIHSGNKSGQFPIPVSLAKSATKFRVFLLGLKRSKSESKQSPPPQNPPNNHQNTHNTTSNKKFFTVKFKVEEVPIISLLTRASSNSKVNSNSTPTTNINEGEDPQQQKQEKGEEKEKCDRSKLENSEENEKKNKKEVVQKYLKMVKPLYIKVSKKNTRNQKGTAEKKEKIVGLSQKQGGSGGLNLKVIAKKHLGKSKSAVVHSMVQNTTNTTSLSSSSSSNKRDDSLLQQQDGIQSAILHCKRSFNSSKDFLDGEEASSVLLTQLVDEKSGETEEEGNGVVVAA